MDASDFISSYELIIKWTMMQSITMGILYTLYQQVPLLLFNVSTFGN
jgi:hypothetical protein